MFQGFTDIMTIYHNKMALDGQKQGFKRWKGIRFQISMQPQQGWLLYKWEDKAGSNSTLSRPEEAFNIKVIDC